jgi:hypothetical protein
MTTVLADATEGPGTHVLAIGVGHYPHQPASFQLESPGLSVNGFLEWAVNIDPPAQPLRSIEAVVSTAEPLTVPGASGEKIALERANIDGVQTAFSRWYERLDTHEGNIGIFYHCGHGIERQIQALITDDFGEDPGNPWRGAYDFDGTYNAMRQNKARHQYFFVDACRDLPLDVERLPALQVMALRQPRFVSDQRSHAEVIYATRDSMKAHARRGQPTVFAHALLEALGGTAATIGPDGLTWVVTGGTLLQAVREGVRRYAGTKPQRAASKGHANENAILTRLKKPQVALEVRYVPQTGLGGRLTPDARVSCL